MVKARDGQVVNVWVRACSGLLFETPWYEAEEWA